MICKECGAKIENLTRICPHCGGRALVDDELEFSRRYGGPKTP